MKITDYDGRDFFLGKEGQLLTIHSSHMDLKLSATNVAALLVFVQDNFFPLRFKAQVDLNESKGIYGVPDDDSPENS